MTSTPVNTFKNLEAQLEAQRPGSLAEAQRLAAEIVDARTASATVVWQVFWPKPLYTNTRVATGQKYIAKLEPLLSDAWAAWAKPGHLYHLEKVPGSRGNAAFRATHKVGKAAIDALGIARSRMYAIQLAADALRKRAQAAEHPYSNLAELGPVQALHQVKSELGYGWGHITVLHFLTDLGLAIKPDRHVVRTCMHLQLLPDKHFADRPTETEALVLVEAVKAFGKTLYGSPVTPAQLRYLDKVLMGISQYGLIG